MRTQPQRNRPRRGRTTLGWIVGALLGLSVAAASGARAATVSMPIAADTAGSSAPGFANGASGSGAPLQIGAIQPLYVTSDGNATHALTPGSFVDPTYVATSVALDHDGVAKLLITRSSGTSLCTGTLLAGGRFILTAAHCVSDAKGVVDVTSVKASWELTSDTLSASSSTVHVHSNYTGDATAGYDVALIELATPVIPAVPRYTVYTDTANLAAPTIKVGYGNTGYGQTGYVNATYGTKRFGWNRYEFDARAVLQSLGVTTLPQPFHTLAYDFDSGSAANDAFGVLYGPLYADLGFGADEVGAAPGDSGGPSFVFTGSGWELLGVTSYGFSLSGTGSPDSSPGTNSSWGEIMVDTRAGAYRDFIAQFDPLAVGVPEPGPLAYLALAAAALLVGRARPRA